MDKIKINIKMKHSSRPVGTKKDESVKLFSTKINRKARDVHAKAAKKI